jgi:DNA-binding response OmpR family regulator
MKRILVVEDDPVMQMSLRDGFSFNGFDVIAAGDGAEALRLAQERNVDVVVLDVMLPKMSGIDVCKRLRNAESDVPIIMLTARGQEEDKVAGLRCGADDYVTKPFSFLELLARVEAVLRRRGGAGADDHYAFGDVSVDFRTYEAAKGGRPLDLSPLEFKMLKFFVDRRHNIVSREQILEAVWGSSSDSITRTVDVHVAKIRKKIEDVPEHPKYIVTVYGSGYKFLG